VAGTASQAAQRRAHDIQGVTGIPSGKRSSCRLCTNRADQTTD